MATRKATLTFLNDFDKPEPFRMPPMPCGVYHVTLPFGTVYEYHIARMPRRAKHKGKYGLFWHSKDEGQVLLAVYDFGKSAFERIDSIAEHQAAWAYWCERQKVLEVLRCAWCGRGKMLPDTLLHLKCTSKAA